MVENEVDAEIFGTMLNSPWKKQTNKKLPFLDVECEMDGRGGGVVITKVYHKGTYTGVTNEG